jgi:hypothetical protein
VGTADVRAWGTTAPLMWHDDEERDGVGFISLSADELCDVGMGDELSNQWSSHARSGESRRRYEES